MAISNPKKVGGNTGGTPLAKIEFSHIGHNTAFLVEAGAQCSQSPITAEGGR
jgi:hypothetical protein